MAGTLTYIGVEMVSHELDEVSEPQDFVLSLTMCGLKPISCSRLNAKMVAVSLGAAIMAVLAIWA